jgi:hypothetical protein
MESCDIAARKGQELKERIMAGVNDVNRYPVIGPTSSPRPPDMIQTKETLT